MKIAFVNQPICVLLPPYQSSVGTCTYGLATSLAQTCDVMVYGRKQTINRQVHPDIETDHFEQGVRFRFLPSPTSDQILSKAGRAFFEYVPFSMVFNRGMKPAPSTASWRYPGYTRRVAIDLQNQQRDIIHIQQSSQFIPAIRSLNPHAKIILHLHAEWFQQSDPVMLLQRIQHADLITTVSDYVTETTRRNFPQISDRCETLYNGIDHRQFTKEKNYAQLRQRKVKRIMFAGRIAPEKGVHILIEAFNRVAKHYPDVEMVVVGEYGVGLMEEFFPMNDRALIQNLKHMYKNFVLQLKQNLDPAVADKVSFPGSISRAELIQYYYDTDIFVFPSIWGEAFGLPPIEAMATGTPVVGTKIGAIVETVENGKIGILVKPQDSAALAAAILQLLENSDLREAMGRAGRQRVLRQFTWDRISQQALEKYSRLINQSLNKEIASLVQ